MKKRILLMNILFLVWSMLHFMLLLMFFPPQASNLIYVDQPTGTGFSYSTDERDTRHDEQGVSNDLYDFLHVYMSSLIINWVLDKLLLFLWTTQFLIGYFSS